MTQPPAPPTPPSGPQPPASEEDALRAWKEEQGYQKFAAYMKRFLTEQASANQPPPPKTDKPKSGGILDSLFG